MTRWTRSPTLLKLFVGQHVANGLGVAAGVMAVTIASTAALGLGAGFAFTLGAIAASIGDFPAALRDKAKSMSMASRLRCSRPPSRCSPSAGLCGRSPP